MENWKEIQGYEEYPVSDLGNVRMTSNNASRKERILKPLKAGKGYFRVALWKNNKAKFIFKFERFTSSIAISSRDSLLEFL